MIKTDLYYYHCTKCNAIHYSFNLKRTKDIDKPRLAHLFRNHCFYDKDKKTSKELHLEALGYSYM